MDDSSTAPARNGGAIGIRGVSVSRKKSFRRCKEPSPASAQKGEVKGSGEIGGRYINNSVGVNSLHPLPAPKGGK